MLSDVVYPIQKSLKAKPKVVHSDRLKPYLGPPLKRWIPKRQAQLSIPREEGRQTSVVDSNCVDEGQSAPVNAREGVERDETESTEADKDDVSQRLQNADFIGDDNGDKTEDVRKPEPRAKLTTYVAHDLNQAGVACQTAESTVQGLPGIDSSVCGRPPGQRQPPSRFGTWVTD